MNWLELVAAALGVVNIVLLVRRSLWNYPFALAMVTLYAGIFYRQRLYSDALLQAFFLILNLYGWWNWARESAIDRPIDVARLGWRARAGWLLAASLATLAWGTAMACFTDAVLPYLDGAIAMFSIAAQFLLARRLIENWAVWIAVDLIASGVYLSRHLYATAILYTIMLALCIAGWRAWRRAEVTAAGAAA